MYSGRTDYPGKWSRHPCMGEYRVSNRDISGSAIAEQTKTMVGNIYFVVRRQTKTLQPVFADALLFDVSVERRLYQQKLTKPTHKLPISDTVRGMVKPVSGPAEKLRSLLFRIACKCVYFG